MTQNPICSIRQASQEVLVEIQVDKCQNEKSSIFLSRRRVYCHYNSILEESDITTNLDNPNLGSKGSHQSATEVSLNFLRCLIQSHFQQSPDLVDGIDLLTEFISTSHFESIQFLHLLRTHHRKLMHYGPCLVDPIYQTIFNLIFLQHSVLTDWCASFQPGVGSLSDAFGVELILFEFSPDPFSFSQQIDIVPSRFFKLWINSVQTVADQFFRIVFESFIAHLDRLENEVTNFFSCLVPKELHGSVALRQFQPMATSESPSVTLVTDLLLKVKHIAAILAYLCSTSSQGYQLGLKLSGWILVDSNEGNCNVSTVELQPPSRNWFSSLTPISNGTLDQNLPRPTKTTTRPSTKEETAPTDNPVRMSTTVALLGQLVDKVFRLMSMSVQEIYRRRLGDFSCPDSECLSSSLVKIDLILKGIVTEVYEQSRKLLEW